MSTDISPHSSTRRHESARGHVELERPQRRVAILRAAGRVDVACSRWLCAHLDDAWSDAAPQLVVFDDFELLEGYEPQAKAQIVGWLQAHPQVVSHVLVRSRIVAMAVTVAKLVTGADVYSYESRASWTRALETALKHSSL